MDARHVLLANDNDFGVTDAGGKSGAVPRNCLWLIELPDALPIAPHT